MNKHHQTTTAAAAATTTAAASSSNYNNTTTTSSSSSSNNNIKHRVASLFNTHAVFGRRQGALLLYRRLAGACTTAPAPAANCSQRGSIKGDKPNFAIASIPFVVVTALGTRGGRSCDCDGASCSECRWSWLAVAVFPPFIFCASSMTSRGLALSGIIMAI